MRFMVIVQGDDRTEQGVMQSEQESAEMAKYNEQLIKAGVMLAGEGLHPTSKGAKVRFEGEKRTVVAGPFKEGKELVAGFWLLQAKSKDEVIEWVKRAPFRERELEIRQVFEPEDLGDSPAIEHHRRNDELRAQR